jgi:hypothetical protein
VAARALAELPPGRRVVSFCEPCGEIQPSWITRLEVADAHTVENAEYVEIAVDHRDVDLAYTFVETKPGRFVNLARLAKCPAHGVSRSLDLGAFPPIPELAPQIEPERAIEVLPPAQERAPVGPPPQAEDPYVSRPQAPRPAPRDDSSNPEPAVDRAPPPSDRGWLMFWIGSLVVAPLFALGIVAGLHSRRRRRA